MKYRPKQCPTCANRGYRSEDGYSWCKEAAWGNAQFKGESQQTCSAYLVVLRGKKGNE